ncbi:MAG: hypothetical protein ACKO3M_02110 [Rubrivivax sp.]
MTTRKTPAKRAGAKVRRPAAAEAAQPAPAQSRKRVGPAVSKAAAAPSAEPVAPAGKPAATGTKLVRDSFTMPQADFELVALLKARALEFKRPTKKSELLRAGLHALNRLNDKALQAALESLTPLKTGRPKKPA